MSFMSVPVRGMGDPLYLFLKCFNLLTVSMGNYSANISAVYILRPCGWKGVTEVGICHDMLKLEGHMLT